MLTSNLKITIAIYFDDKTWRVIESYINNSDTPNTLTNEIISQGLISKVSDFYVTSKTIINKQVQKH